MNKLWKLPFVLQSKLPFKFFPDKLYLSSTFRGLMGQKLSFEHPRTFNEKLQVMKLNTDTPEFSRWVDKITAKEQAAAVIGDEAVIETLSASDSIEEFEKIRPSLPDRYVLKTTHNSGGVWIIDPEHPYDDRIRAEVLKNLNTNYYNQWREGPYRNVKPRLLAEKYMGADLKDYKFFCFHGEPRVVLVCSDRSSQLKEDFLDPEWNLLDFGRAKHPRSEKAPEKPEKLEQMTEMAQKLSSGFDFVRVDLFDIDGNIYFGEMTFFPACGFEGFDPENWDAVMGEWI